MKFVIDLNSMRSAWTGVNPNDLSHDLSAAVLFAKIIQVCFTIVVTDEIHTRYLHLFDTLRQARSQSPAALNIVNIYTRAWETSGKIDASRQSASLPPLSDETHIKDEDIEFSRAAGISRSILITFDQPLLNALTPLGVRALPPPEALERLRNGTL